MKLTLIITNIIKKNPSKAYIVAVLLITWIITILLFINPVTGKKNFALVMFIPAILAIIFNKITQEKQMDLLKNATLKSLLFGIFYPIAFVSVCSLIAQFTGLGNISVNGTSAFKTIIFIITTATIGLFSAWGEEYGWRGYLLPKLTNTHGKTKATIIVGIVWGLFHVPAVFMLARASGIGNPLLLCAVQAFSAFMFSFPSSYCYYSSGSLLPVLFLHSVWNTANPFMLGDIYMNTPGLIKGNLIQINGEGILGCMVGAIMIFYFIKLFKSTPPLN